MTFREEVKIGGNLMYGTAKGQLISKAIYGLLTSPKKRRDEFVLFAFLLFTANKSNSSVRFLGESTACQSAFRFYLTFKIHPNFDDRFLVDMRFVEVANMKLFCQFCKNNFTFSICEKRIKELIV